MASKTVFLSSTARDLHEHRAKVSETIERLGYECVQMEKFGAADSTPAELCHKRVRECDMFVGIVGWLYGSSPPDDERSFTEMEYDAAVAERRPRLMFLAPEQFLLPAEFRQNDERQARQEAFRRRVGLERTCDTFDSPDDLARRVAEAIAKQLSTAERAESAFATLGELMREPEVRDAVIRFRTEFENACQQIRVVADNKEIHDLFHAMQFQSYGQLLLLYRRPASEEDWAELETYTDQFEDTVTKLRDLAAAVSPQPGRPEWVQELEDALRTLRTAIDCREIERRREEIKRALRLIREVLDIEPSRINTRLHSAARSLRLQELVEAMSVIRAKLAETDLDAQRLRQFDEGVDALQHLSHRIHDLANRHDKWQELENNLRRVEAMLGRDVEELEASWPKIKRMVEDLDGSSDLMEHIARVQKALDSKDEQTARRSFERYRWRAGQVFFTVDTDLKKLCDGLREVGKPLTWVLEMIR